MDKHNLSGKNNTHKTFYCVKDPKTSAETASWIVDFDKHGPNLTSQHVQSMKHAWYPKDKGYIPLLASSESTFRFFADQGGGSMSIERKQHKSTRPFVFNYDLEACFVLRTKCFCFQPDPGKSSFESETTRFFISAIEKLLNPEQYQKLKQGV